MPPPSGEVRQRILDLLGWLKENPDEFPPIELAAIFHYRLVQIHPFNEGNGRTSRLLMNAILIRNGYPYITNITNRDRTRYLRTISEADQGNTSPLVNIIAKSVEQALDTYLNTIEEPEILSLAKAAQRTIYSQEYLSLLARKGSIGAFKRGRNWHITRRDLERYIKSTEAKKRKNR